MPTSKKLKVAIVHDWLIGGGAERVVYALHKLYPDAPIYTSYCTDEWRKRLDGKVITGFLQHGPFPKLRKFVGLLRIWWFGRIDFSGYDLVLSSSGNGEAFSVRVPKGTVHITYCHTPTHYYWRHYNQYMRRPGMGVFNPLARLGLWLLVNPLRKWDFKTAQRPDYFIANSTHIQADIKKYYGRESTVIHPPIDVARFMKATAEKRVGFVTAGRQVPAKHTDIIVAACTRLNLPLTVVGKGPEHNQLVKMAGPTITFREFVTDNEMPQALAGAKAFIFASLDDFGIVPIEAMAASTPVIAYKAGGALDYVIPSKTGEFFDGQTVEALSKVLQSFNDKKYTPSKIKQYANTYAPEVFENKMRQFIDTHLSQQ